MDQIYGGVRSYVGSPTVASTIINATHAFTANYTDRKAAVIVTTERTALIDLWVVFFFYNGATPPPSTFAAYETLTPLSDNVKTQSFASLLDANNALNLNGLRYLIRGQTLPVLPGTNGTDLLNHQYQVFSSQAVAATTINNPDFVYSMAYQPFPIAIPLASQNQSDINGPNSFSLDPSAGDHMWMEYDISWLTELGDDHAHAQAMNLTDYILPYARSTYPGVAPTHYSGSGSGSGSGSSSSGGEGGEEVGGLDTTSYTPIFTNDAMYDQTPLQSYRGYNNLVSAKANWDPEGFFTNRTGGFKL